MNTTLETTPSTALRTEYLMTIHAPSGGKPRAVDRHLTVYHSTEGWVKGPNFSGKILPPTGDWLELTPQGNLNVDARMLIETDDGAAIYANYTGILKAAPADFMRMARGEVLTSDDIYFVTTPRFRTSQTRYAWLNGLQTVGKLAEIKGGEGGYVRYDIYAIR